MHVFLCYNEMNEQANNDMRYSSLYILQNNVLSELYIIYII